MDELSGSDRHDLFGAAGGDGRLARHAVTGGPMPSVDLPGRFGDDGPLVRQGRVAQRHRR